MIESVKVWTVIQTECSFLKLTLTLGTPAMECMPYMEQCVDLPSHLLSTEQSPAVRVRHTASETGLDINRRYTKTKTSNTCQ